MPPKTAIDRELNVVDFRIKTNSFNEALYLLSHLIEEQKATDEVWLRKGICHQQLAKTPNSDNNTFDKQKELALKAFTEALRINPNNNNAKNQLRETENMLPNRQTTPSF